MEVPLWKDIPQVEGMPHGTAWGLFDRPSPSAPGEKIKDEVGTLNHLTPSVVARAGKEIQAGVSVALNWGLEKLDNPGFGRHRFQHDLVDWRKKPKGQGGDLWSFDDEISFNTQSGSQWDGLRHWGHSKTGLYYNGHQHMDMAGSPHLGIENYTRRGGIVGRGVLLDYVSYAARHNIEYSPMSAHSITIPALEAIAKEEEVEFLPGDILIVRSGWTKWYDEHSDEERDRYIKNGSAWIGVEGSRECVEWLWDHRFAAVAADNIGFEVWPPTSDEYKLHDHCLSMWGMPLGEMWDLEALAAECERQKRWSFFFTSSPLNIKGGAASPPNAIATF